MQFYPEDEGKLHRLTLELRLARALTPRLIANVVAVTCTRLPALNAAGKAAQIDRLIGAGAWIDAALFLIELELPRWKVARLSFEDGMWLCSLSKQPNVPIWLDDTADAGHETLPLAILGSFVEACHRIRVERADRRPAVPLVSLPSSCPICCDDFA